MRFCIVGTGRCGTSLLRQLFNSHPHVFVFGETHWIPKMFEFFGTGEADANALIDIIQRTYHELGNPVTPLDEELLKFVLERTQKTTTVQEFCNTLGMAFAERDNKRYWADKTPDYGPYMHMLSELWPDCKFVHIIRNGLETAVSMSRHHGFQWMVATGERWWVPASFNRYYQAAPKADKPFESFLDLWYWRLQRIRNEATRLSPGNYMEVRFDELLENPGRTLSNIAEFVDLPAEHTCLSQAAARVDPSSTKSSAHDFDGTALSVRTRTLLENLGYLNAPR